MNQLNSINHISSLLSRFVAQVKGLNAINQYGINYLSETVLIPVFKEIFDYNDLQNLNTSEAKNFPGIDVGDRTKRVAFQISSNTNWDKIKNTLRKFNDHKHYESFDKLLIYCIGEKAVINPDKDISEYTENKFKFNIASDILDYTDILKAINSITDYDKILRVEELLNKQFSELKLEKYKETLESSLSETVFTNLLKISLPDKLFTARIDIKRKDLKNKKAKVFNDRELIFQYKKDNDLRFSADWIDHEKQLYSFHDLSNSSHDISKVIDLGTVDTLNTSEFYEQSVNHERAFKALLKFCFAKYAYFLGIEFKHKENLFVFSCENDQAIARNESWNSGKRSASRDVIKIKRNKKTNDVWYYTHLAFSVAFKLYSGQWFMEITPDWYVTKDGVIKHYMRDKEVVSWLKRRERNMHVLNNTKFIANYLKYGRIQGSLFEDGEVRRPKNFLDFQNFETFNNSPLLLEDDWKLDEPEDIIDLMKDMEGNIDSDL